MKARLEYDSKIDGMGDILAAIHGSSAFFALWDLDQYLRTMSKHGDDEKRADFADEIRTWLLETMAHHNINHEMTDE